MADDFYGEMRAMASEMLAEFNQAEYVLIRTSSPTPAANSWEEPTPGTSQTFTLYGIAKSRKVEFTDGNGVIHQAAELLMAAFEDEPKPGDILTKNGAPLTVLDVTPVTDLGLAWKFTVKG